MVVPIGGCLFSVSLPQGALSRSVICDCGISWSYPTYIFVVNKNATSPCKVSNYRFSPRLDSDK